MDIRRLKAPRIRERTITSATAQGPDYMTRLCHQAPRALDVIRESKLRRITEWRTDCKECHILVLDLLFEWVITDGVPIYLAQGDKPGKAVLFGEPERLPGRKPISSVLPSPRTIHPKASHTMQKETPIYTWVPKRGTTQNIQDEKENNAVS